MNLEKRDAGSLTWAVAKPSEFNSLATDWDDLVTRAGYPAFMRAAFIANAISTFGCAGGRLVLARRGASLEAAGILVPVGAGQWSTYQPSQVPLGCWVMSRDLHWERVLPSVVKTLPGLPILVSFTQQDPHLVARPSSDEYVETLDYVATGWIDISGTFEAFWQARGKNLRQNLRKQRRRLEEQGNRLVFEFLDRPRDVDDAFLQFAELEGTGWKSTAGTAITAENVQGTFYRTVLGELAVAGASIAMRLLVNGRPVAVDFGLRDVDSVVVLKTTYDESLKALSPAQLLHEQAFEFIFRQSSVRRIEFYGKFMEWHARWTEQTRMLFHLNYYRFPSLRLLRNFLKRFKRHASARGPAPGTGSAVCG